MHCPNCGKQSSSNQKFCRSCGMSLEDVSKAVASHLSAMDDNKPSSENESNRRRRMAIILFWSVVMVLTGALIIGVGKRMVQDELITLIGKLITVGGILVAAYSAMSPLWQQTSKSRRDEPTALMESSPGINTSPEGLPAPFPSVTEQTTRVLKSDEVNK